jgi:hypothetical protein
MNNLSGELRPQPRSESGTSQIQAYSIKDTSEKYMVVSNSSRTESGTAATRYVGWSLFMHIKISQVQVKLRMVGR